MKKALLITVLVLLAVAIGIYAYNTKNSQMTQLSLRLTISKIIYLIKSI